MDVIIIRNNFTSQLKIMPIGEFIQYYGITPWDCYLKHACEMNNIELVSISLSRGAKYCSNCCNANHTDNIKKILNDVAQFILVHTSDENKSNEDVDVMHVEQDNVVKHGVQMRQENSKTVISSNYIREHDFTRRVNSSKRILRLVK